MEKTNKHEKTTHYMFTDLIEQWHRPLLLHLVSMECLPLLFLMTLLLHQPPNHPN